MAEVFAECGITVTGSASVSGAGIFQGSATLAVVSSMAALSTRVKSGASALSVVGSLALTGTAYITQYLAYSGTIAAGEVLVIDCENMTVKLDGVNARANHSGAFPTLYAGTNELRWADDDASRTVGIEVEHEPRYL